MAGIDYSKAELEYREAFSFTKAALSEAVQEIRGRFAPLGCVILSTCNRTEIWISGETGSTPLEMLCAVKGVSAAENEAYFTSRSGMDAVSYLMELACGLKSQIFGEDQILTQIKDAISFARENGTADTVLEILFRDAVTAAKKVKSTVRLTQVNGSMAVSTVSLLREKLGNLRDRRCMVIGNGEMGRLAAAALVDQGCRVCMTLRQYKSQDAVIPGGCRVVNYDERMEQLPQMDIVVSATLSPHYTLKYEETVPVLAGKPLVIVDLAVPRDVDPQLKEYENLTVYDVDDLGGRLSEGDCIQVQEAKKVLEEYEQDFQNWYYFREWIPSIQHISKLTSKDIAGRTRKQMKNLPLEEAEGHQLRKTVNSASQKAVSKLLFGLREHLDKDVWNDCITALEKAAEDSREECGRGVR